MNVVDGGCFMALSDSLVAVDLRLVEDFTRVDLLHRCNMLDGVTPVNACLIERSRAGLWYVYAITESSGCEIDEDRVAALVCIASSDIDPTVATAEYLLGLSWKDVPRNVSNWFTNDVQVKCGTVGLLCMESVRRCAKSHGLVPENCEEFSNYIREWANTMCQITTTSSKVSLSNFPGGPIGAVSSVGICDNGNYNCQVLKDEVTEEVSGVKIVFPSMEPVTTS
ncbi:uncharacterized protein BXIN_2258 [Babesia sp. Xinjiang]|uniref:uncharacterized protein n=1 Tax=Babesia sp. Xinjiang TaxID=462227 RepID=UPI000A249009|nr:uncharacterized protein BXIN_2258 [Babesia sp. Xinjiang]ORM40645.1 hypothetical protein BXIN_2258 [Babesia sp. Xinjiang]